MPIRTSHGRAAAYRSIWQWPLRSPARLAVTGIVALALLGGVSYGVGVARGPGAAGRPGAAVPPSSSAGLASSAGPLSSAGPAGTGTVPVTVLPPVTELTPTTLPTSAAPRAALDVVTHWSAAWVRPPAGTTTAQWLAGLAPYTTPEYLGVLYGIDPQNVPATRVTGAARAVRVSPRSVRVQMPTDALTLLVTVVDTDSGWLVSGYDRA